MIQPTALQEGWRGHPGISGTHHHPPSTKASCSLKSQPWQAAYGTRNRFFTPRRLWKLLATGCYATIRRLQDSRGDRPRNLLGVANCAETCLVHEVSALETGTVLWGNSVIFWALILDLPSNVIHERLENRQAQLQPSLRRKISAAPGQFARVGSCWHNIPARALLIIYL